MRRRVRSGWCVAIALALAACRRDPPRPSPPPSPAPVSRAPAADGGESFAILNTPEGLERVSPAEAVARLTRECESRVAVSCFSLGMLYENGSFVAADAARAVELFRRGCDGGEMRACSELGTMYEEGSGVKRDLARAKALYLKACDGGRALGCNNLVLAPARKPTPAELAHALERYRAICDAADGDPAACSTLGSFMLQGKLLPRDDARAARLFGRACDRGDGLGCNNLGALLALGRGVAKDPAKARSFYLRACNAGSAEGCRNLGINPADAPVQTIRRPMP